MANLHEPSEWRVDEVLDQLVAEEGWAEVIQAIDDFDAGKITFSAAIWAVHQGANLAVGGVLKRGWEWGERRAA